VFTSALSAGAEAGDVEPGTNQKLGGVVKFFSTVRWYGFITGDDGEEIYFQSSGIIGQPYGYVDKGQRVRFAVIETPRGEEAVDVEVIG
jgi:CspA family cold shock protein